jgi:hypothetical protein
MADPYDPECVRSVVRHLDELRGAFADLLRSTPLEVLSARPEPDRWSAVENLRHMIFVEELYTNRWLLGVDAPWSRLGLVADFLVGNPDYSDVGSEPTDDVEALLAAWAGAHARTVELVARVTPEELRRETSYGDARPGPVGKVLKVLVDHTLSHVRQAEAAIGEGSLHL